MAENEKNMDLCELKCTLIDALKTQMSGGVGNVDAEEAGEVVDMIKDFAQTDYYEAKAHYYRTVEKVSPVAAMAMFADWTVIWTTVTVWRCPNGGRWIIWPILTSLILAATAWGTRPTVK